MYLCVCSDIQALQRNVSSEPTSTVKSTQSREDTPCGKPPLDNGQYLDIRGFTETDSSSDANTTKTSTTTTTTTDCTESTTTATQPHGKLKSQSQQGKISVQFDQPNRWEPALPHCSGHSYNYKKKGVDDMHIWIKKHSNEQTSIRSEILVIFLSRPHFLHNGHS